MKKKKEKACRYFGSSRTAGRRGGRPTDSGGPARLWLARSSWADVSGVPDDALEGASAVRRASQVEGASRNRLGADGADLEKREVASGAARRGVVGDGRAAVLQAHVAIAQAFGELSIVRRAFFGFSAVQWLFLALAFQGGPPSFVRQEKQQNRRE